MDTLAQVGLGAVVFASTNVDDIFLLAAFFADASVRRGSIVAGQLLGIGVLVAVSAVAALGALVIPADYTALVGLVPLSLGLLQLAALWRSAGSPADEELLRGRPAHSDVLTVASVTIANGGDNLGAYVPLFASAPGAIPLYAAVFAVMTVVWCWLGRWLVGNRWVGHRIRRYGHAALPLVLIALGFLILWDARGLFR